MGDPLSTALKNSHRISHQIAFCDMKWETAARKKKKKGYGLVCQKSHRAEWTMAEKAENNGARENVPQTEAPLKTLLKSVKEANASPDNTGNLDLLAY